MRARIPREVKRCIDVCGSKGAGEDRWIAHRPFDEGKAGALRERHNRGTRGRKKVLHTDDFLTIRDEASRQCAADVPYASQQDGHWHPLPGNGIRIVTDRSRIMPTCPPPRSSAP